VESNFARLDYVCKPGSRVLIVIDEKGKVTAREDG
jgi:hypothetical protein